MMESGKTLTIFCLLITTTLLQISDCKEEFKWDAARLHVGCYQDKDDVPDLDIEVKDDAVKGTLRSCVEACFGRHFMYAGVQNGNECHCGSVYGRYGRGQCQTPCSKESNQMCGGEQSNAVFSTGMKVPGPPSNLSLTSVSTDSLTIEWSFPIGSPVDFVKQFKVKAEVKKSFDSMLAHKNPAKEISLSGHSNSTTIIGLKPGTQYNITVFAESSHGKGLPASDLFWTEVGPPVAPNTPTLIQHQGDNHSGEIHIKFDPVLRNPNGPVSSYRIVVINETVSSPFDPDNLVGWEAAEEDGLQYWITAEIGPDWFNHHDEFIVGDKQFYGGYLNYGPLPKDQDFHVTVGTVSSLNKMTKVTYAKVSHDQHSDENIIVFKFHDHSKDHHHHHGDSHGHSHHKAQNPKLILTDNQERHPRQHLENMSLWNTVLITAIVIVSLLLLATILLFVLAKLGVFKKRRSSGRSDVQELTPPRQESEEFSGYSNGIETSELPDYSSGILDYIRDRTWLIPRNFLSLESEVIGRGSFGSVMKGSVNKRGVHEDAVVQVVAEKLLSKGETKDFARELDTSIRSGIHDNVLQLHGLCEENDSTIFVVMESGIRTLKQQLLDSRTLIHYPLYAEKYKTVSSTSESRIFDHLIEAARGMQHLADMKIFHKRLCARNVHIVNDIAKIGGFGIFSYSDSGQDLDVIRWTAQEAFNSKSYSSKCDVWSFGCLMWETVTLGATPYSDVPTTEVPNRVIRGLRPVRIPEVSDDLYQLMLECWQYDLDERPTFQTIEAHLNEMRHHGEKTHLNYNCYDGHRYQDFRNDLEIKVTGKK